MHRRRVTRIVLLALLLATAGAIVNVAVAWGCGWRSRAYGDGMNDGMLRGAATRGRSPDAETRVYLWRTMGPGVQWLKVFKTQWSEDIMFDDFQPLEEVWPAWIAYDDLRLSSVPYDPMLGVAGQGTIGEEVVAQGWPMLALWCENLEYGRFEGGIMLFRQSAWDASFHSVSHVLAFRPLWPGFAINTIFYAAVLWMLFAFPFVVRRRRRIKRGLCPACAYPVGGSPVCTECGASLPLPLGEGRGEGA